jgi:hypothetical protein
LGDYYLQDKTIAIQAFDPLAATRDESRLWFVEDLVMEEAYPQTHAWLQTNTRQMADFDVYVQARTFPMRVYLYDPKAQPLH